MIASGIVVVLQLLGCGQTHRNLTDTMQSLLKTRDVTVTAKQVNSLPYASIYAKLDGQTQAFMVLAFAETATKIAPSAVTPQLKWLSADLSMLVTSHGRLIKTLGLPKGNLLNTSNLVTDPVALGLHKLTTHTNKWQRIIDWQPGYHFGYQLISKFTPKTPSSIQIMVNGRPVTVLHIIEHVAIDSLDIKYTNDFYVNPINGKVIKSRQKIAPNLPYVEIIHLKPYVIAAS